MISTTPTSFTELFGQPPPPTNGRERLLAVAIDLFYHEGFAAVGLDRVMHAAGVTKTTFYKHFESKEDLMVAAVRRRDEWEWQAWLRAARQMAGEDATPAEFFLGCLDVLDLWFHDSDCRGCLFTNVAVEFPNPNDPVHQAAAEFKHRSRNARRDLALQAGAAADDAETFADCYTALLEGAMVLRVTQGRDDAARVVRPAVEQLIRTYLPNSLSLPNSR